jgi:hypothetical protein
VGRYRGNGGKLPARTPGLHSRSDRGRRNNRAASELVGFVVVFIHYKTQGGGDI